MKEVVLLLLIWCSPAGCYDYKGLELKSHKECYQMRMQARKINKHPHLETYCVDKSNAPFIMTRFR